MELSWKSIKRIPWGPEGDKLLMGLIEKETGETHTALAIKISDHPIVDGRSLNAIKQRIGWLRAKMKNSI